MDIPYTHAINIYIFNNTTQSSDLDMGGLYVSGQLWP